MTVAEAVVEPPGPVAVRTYVVESLGDTLRLPVFCTLPIPELMETLVALPLTCHRSVADWPRWMVVGSAENCATVGALGGGGGVTVGWAGGGGGGGGGAFFLHPAANIARETARQMAETFDLLNMNNASCYVATYPK